MKKINLFLSFFLISSFALTQSKFTLSGTITDLSKGEAIIGARLKLKDQNVGALSNEYGFFSLTLPQGSYTFIISSIGFESQTKVIDLTSNVVLNVLLSNPTQGDQVKELDEVKINAIRKDNNIKNAIMGVEKLDPKAIAKIPVLFGEKDIIKTMQLLPGVKSAGEGNAGYYVRGGGSDQNLILLDEAPVYNASHLLGFFSTFNSDAIKDATLYKGNQPANFGGRLASVLDIKMNEGNNHRYNVSGGLGLISSKLNV